MTNGTFSPLCFGWLRADARRHIMTHPLHDAPAVRGAVLRLLTSAADLYPATILAHHDPSAMRLARLRQLAVETRVDLDALDAAIAAAEAGVTA
jgi:hypothetical protein